MTEIALYYGGIILAIVVLFAAANLLRLGPGWLYQFMLRMFRS